MALYMPKSSVSKLTHDYLKLYNDMIEKWRIFLGENTPPPTRPEGARQPFHSITFLRNYILTIKIFILIHLLFLLVHLLLFALCRLNNNMNIC